MPAVDVLRSSRVVCESEGTSCEAEVWLRKLTDSTKMLSEASGKEAEKSDKVYLVDGLPPLTKKMVEAIRRGDFVQFADFHVFH